MPLRPSNRDSISGKNQSFHYPILRDKRPFFKTIFILHKELSNKEDRNKWKTNKIYWLDFLKVCWYRNVYPLFKSFRLKKYYVQDAWNCITCSRIKASKTLPLSLSANRIRLRGLVCFSQVPRRFPEELFAASPQNPKRLRLLLVKEGYSKELLQKNYFS